MNRGARYTHILTKLLTKGLVCLLYVIAFIAPITPSTPAYAATPLDQPRDIASSIAPAIAQVTHEASFTLPPLAQQIFPNNFIRIYMPNYNNLSLPSIVIGGIGTPTFGFSNGNKTITVTNIGLIPGTPITISGFLADSPPANVSPEIWLEVTDDAAGTIVRNRSIVVPTQGGSVITISTTVTSPLSTLAMQGRTSPNAFVTLTELGSVISTTSADGTGVFNFGLTGITPGSHTYRIYSTDSVGRASSQYVITTFLPPEALTTISNIVLSPSITLDKSSIEVGQIITATGSTFPFATITVLLESPLQSFTTTSDAVGAWTYTFSGAFTGSLSPGEYRVSVISTDGSGNQSVNSPTINFTVTANSTVNPPPCGNISKGDLNCNSVVNLTDFSILLFFWGTNQRRADINSNNKVDLTDFSIMMYYFGQSV
jgi:hypothetical protein